MDGYQTNFDRWWRWYAYLGVLLVPVVGGGGLNFHGLVS